MQERSRIDYVPGRVTSNDGSCDDSTSSLTSRIWSAAASSPRKIRNIFAGAIRPLGAVVVPGSSSSLPPPPSSRLAPLNQQKTLLETAKDLFVFPSAFPTLSDLRFLSRWGGWITPPPLKLDHPNHIIEWRLQMFPSDAPSLFPTLQTPFAVRLRCSRGEDNDDQLSRMAQLALEYIPTLPSEIQRYFVPVLGAYRSIYPHTTEEHQQCVWGWGTSKTEPLLGSSDYVTVLVHFDDGADWVSLWDLLTRRSGSMGGDDVLRVLSSLALALDQLTPYQIAPSLELVDIEVLLLSHPPKIRFCKWTSDREVDKVEDRFWSIVQTLHSSPRTRVIAGYGCVEVLQLSLFGGKATLVAPMPTDDDPTEVKWLPAPPPQLTNLTFANRFLFERMACQRIACPRMACPRSSSPPQSSSVVTFALTALYREISLKISEWMELFRVVCTPAAADASRFVIWDCILEVRYYLQHYNLYIATLDYSVTPEAVEIYGYIQLQIKNFVVQFDATLSQILSKHPPTTNNALWNLIKSPSSRG